MSPEYKEDGYGPKPIERFDMARRFIAIPLLRIPMEWRLDRNWNRM
jgi:hypothetical protein